MVDSFIRHGAPELVKQLTRKGTNVVAKNWNTPASLKPLLQTLNPETVEALAKSATTADGELLPQTINQIADEAVVNPENARRGLGFFQDGVQNKDWGNYGAWQGDIEKKWNIQDQKTQLEAPVPEKEATPRRTDTRAPIEQMLDDIYTEGMDDAQIESFKNQSRFGGKGSITGTQRNILQMSPHHFGMDLELTGKVIGPEDTEVVKELNALDVWPGNHPNNFIGSYHDMSKRITDAQKSQIISATGKSPKEVDKFLKNIPEGSTLGKKELAGKNEWKVMDMIESLKEQKTRNWNQMTEGKMGLEDFELPEALIGVDHQDLIHGAINKLDSRKQLIALAKTPEWATYTPKQKALIIANVAREQQNIALNVSNWRLKKIEKAMKAEGIVIKDWTDIQTWMIQNPQKAAHLDWHKTAQVGTGMTGNQLTKDLPAKRAKLVAQVFNLEKVPETSKLMKGPRKGKMKSSPPAKTVASIPGVSYKGSGKDPAVNKLLDKLKKDGAGSLDSSGMGTRWKV